MIIRFGYDISLSCNAGTSILTRLDVHPDRAFVYDHTFSAAPVPLGPPAHFFDQYGNLVRRLVAPGGMFTLKAEGVLLDSGQRDPITPYAPEVPMQSLPHDVLPFLLGSRYCETDLLSPAAWQLFGSVQPGWRRVQAICDFVHGHLTFSYPHARATRTAFEAYNERIGVCRDFTHLAITLCRAMNIPARYVNGYLGDIGVPADPAPMDFNAWFEAYLGDRWHTFDARHNSPRIGRIVIARGRDATDVPMVHTFGQHTLARFKVVTEEVTGAEAERLMKLPRARFAA